MPIDTRYVTRDGVGQLIVEDTQWRPLPGWGLPYEDDVSSRMRSTCGGQAGVTICIARLPRSCDET